MDLDQLFGERPTLRPDSNSACLNMNAMGNRTVVLPQCTEARWRKDRWRALRPDFLPGESITGPTASERYARQADRNIDRNDLRSMWQLQQTPKIWDDLLVPVIIGKIVQDHAPLAPKPVDAGNPHQG
jgi:hypothetical protein